MIRPTMNWMLHYAGPRVQNVFYTLPEQTKDEEASNEEVKSCGPLAAGYVKFDLRTFTTTVCSN